MSAKALIKELARQFDAEDNNAFDLWTWLPSYQDAVNKHGDYACEFQPVLSDLLYEAALYIGAGLDVNNVSSATREEWFTIHDDR